MVCLRRGGAFQNCSPEPVAPLRPQWNVKAPGDTGLSTPPAIESMVDIRRAASGSTYRCMLVQAGPSIAKRIPQLQYILTKSEPVRTCKIRQLGTNAAIWDGAPRFPLDTWLRYRMVPEKAYPSSAGWRACNLMRHGKFRQRPPGTKNRGSIALSPLRFGFGGALTNSKRRGMAAASLIPARRNWTDHAAIRAGYHD